MAMKTKLKIKDFEFVADPVWAEQDMCLVPIAFFLNWWQTVAERQFGDKTRWIDAAIELGYVVKTYDPIDGKCYLESTGLGYDHILLRQSLCIPENLPIISQTSKDSMRQWERLWTKLLEAPDAN